MSNDIANCSHSHAFTLICFWSLFILNWLDLTLDYEIVMHLLKLKFEPSNLLRLISDEPDVEAI